MLSEHDLNLTYSEAFCAAWAAFSVALQVTPTTAAELP